MAEFEPAYKVVKRHEGGYANHSADRGKETYKGISRKNWPGWSGWEIVDALKQKSGFPNTLDSNERLQVLVSGVYRKNFWSAWYEDMPQELATWVFDKAVLMGSRTAHKILQRALGVEDDGVIGYHTMNAIGKADISSLLAKCRAAYIDYVEGIVEEDPTQAVFLKGWKARA